jgi:hypothetical protein
MNRRNLKKYNRRKIMHGNLATICLVFLKHFERQLHWNISENFILLAKFLAQVWKWKLASDLSAKKIICANPNKRNFDENSILLNLNKDRAESFIHFG